MDEDPLVSMGYGYLNPDDTENDDDDEDDQVAQNKLLILIAKDVKLTSWMVSLSRRLGYPRATLQSDREPSIVALKSATLWAAPFVELNGFCEKALLAKLPPMVLVSLPCVG